MAKFSYFFGVRDPKRQSQKRQDPYDPYLCSSGGRVIPCSTPGRNDENDSPFAPEDSGPRQEIDELFR